MNPDTILKRKENVLSTEIDGETILMAVDCGKYFNLNPVGSAIWELLEKPLAVASLQQQLLDRFEGDPATIRYETQAYIEDLSKRGILDQLTREQ